MENTYQNISKKQILSWVIVRTIFLVLLAAILFTCRYFLNGEQLEDIPKEVITGMNISGIILLILVGFYAIVMPFLQQINWKYRICDDKIEIRHGVITKVIHALPVARIQQITVIRSLSNRIFGLSKIIVETSGNQQIIIGIDKEEAERLALTLNERVNIIAKDDSEVGNL